MIFSEVYIDKYDWHFKVYYAVDCYWSEHIVSMLNQIGAPKKVMLSAFKNMSSCKLDHGLTYSNYNTRKSIVVIGLTSKKSEFINSLTHELRHLVNHICRASEINLFGEESCYLMGDIAESLFPDIERMICSCSNPKKCDCHKMQ